MGQVHEGLNVDFHHIPKDGGVCLVQCGVVAKTGIVYYAIGAFARVVQGIQLVNQCCEGFRLAQICGEHHGLSAERPGLKALQSGGCILCAPNHQNQLLSGFRRLNRPIGTNASGRTRNQRIPHDDEGTDPMVHLCTLKIHAREPQ